MAYPDGRFRILNRVVRFVLLSLAVVAMVIACSTDTQRLFFDIPPTDASEVADQSGQQPEQQAAGKMDPDNRALQYGAPSIGWAIEENSPPPEIEKVKDWEMAESLLPKDEEDNVDWAAALQQGLIRPRSGGNPDRYLMTVFQWDFIIPADEKEDEAYFPHSAHTQWLSCKNCHMAIYPYRRNPATMKEMKKGQSCGVCHGRRKVSFSLKACGRCHLSME